MKNENEVTAGELALLMRAEQEGLCRTELRLYDGYGELVVHWDTNKLKDKGIDPCDFENKED